MSEQTEVVAFIELCQAKSRYCRALDTRDWHALAELMTSDIEFGMGDSDTDPDMIAGRDAALKTLKSLVAGSKTAHQVHNPEIELNGDEAQVIWTVQDRALYEGGPSITGYGHYYERWVRCGGVWKIASVKLIHLIVDVRQTSA